MVHDPTKIPLSHNPQIWVTEQTSWCPLMKGRAEGFTKETRLLYKLMVPQQNWPLILALCYDHPGAGHFGSKKTYARLLEHYCWPWMKWDCEDFVKWCSTCSQMKHQMGLQLGTLHSFSILEAPWRDITVDLVIRLLLIDGYNVVCTVVNRFLREIVVFPTTNMVSTSQLAQSFWDKVWCQHGAPRSIVSDWGP